MFEVEFTNTTNAPIAVLIEVKRLGVARTTRRVIEPGSEAGQYKRPLGASITIRREDSGEVLATA